MYVNRTVYLLASLSIKVFENLSSLSLPNKYDNKKCVILLHASSRSVSNEAAAAAVIGVIVVVEFIKLVKV